MTDSRYRAEDKYLCDILHMQILRSRLSFLMKPDPAGEHYTVKSVYFDDVYDSCLGETLAGVDRRAKYRLRIYNSSLDTIKLEIKRKDKGLTSKDSCIIDEEMARRLVAGDPPLPSSEFSPVLNEFLIAARTRLLRPKMVIEYDREALIYDAGSVRITFDKNIRQNPFAESFFEENCHFASPVNEPLHILEIKYNTLLPAPIAEIADDGSLIKTSFSKYTICRTGALKE